ncbi:hypothetical protein NDU88_005270 [Pleurodeles waltl]|uniref:Uncharacterized protein n=1 Tax=Pleurodeles waltl TaxID=8319 RepID=A0AAV7NQ35_PLEWA|nr:hypothetical protein NDU88_005270 [Pleurodeles waltl]
MGERGSRAGCLLLGPGHVVSLCGWVVPAALAGHNCQGGWAWCPAAPGRAGATKGSGTQVWYPDRRLDDGGFHDGHPRPAEDLQAVKRDLCSDLQEVRRDLDEVGERVVSLEYKDDNGHEELEWMRQEILCLQEQQIELQAHAEDLENYSMRNNIRIWWGGGRGGGLRGGPSRDRGI